MKYFVFALLLAVPAWAVAQDFEPSGDSEGFQANPGNQLPTYGSEEGGEFEPGTGRVNLSRGQEPTMWRAVPTAPAPGPAPLEGPGEFYLYKNRSGKWKLPPAKAPEAGTATYKWLDGSQHKDDLVYIMDGRVRDKGGYGIPQGERVPVWVGMASDKQGRAVFFYFGTEDRISTSLGRRYPMYWSWRSPYDNPTTRRFITPGGTSRD